MTPKEAAKLAIRRLGQHTMDEATHMRAIYAGILSASQPKWSLDTICKNLMLPTKNPPDDNVARVLKAYIWVITHTDPWRLPYIKELQQVIASRYGKSLVPHETMIRRILDQEGLPLNPRGQPRKSKRQK